MPFDSGVTGLFYRSDYLEQAGYKAADMQDLTWDKFIQIGKDVKAKTGHNLLGLDLNGTGLIRIIMQSAGKWYFNADGSLQSAARLTVLLNGVLVQNDSVLKGGTTYIGAPSYRPHGDMPIRLQDHGHLVRYRNIWLRKL